MSTQLSPALPSCAISSKCLLVPTLLERTSRLQTLKSVVPHSHSFDHIFISVNGVSASSVLVECRQCGLDLHPSLLVFATGATLSAVAHGFFIYKKLESLIEKSDLVMLLADDDQLISGVNIPAYFNSIVLPEGTGVGVSRFVLCDQSTGDEVTPVHPLTPSETIRPEEFLVRDISRHLYTNMSGMIVPFNALSNVNSFMRGSFSSGGRYEHMLMIYSGVDFLYSPSQACVRISMHPGQESVRICGWQHYYNDMVYVLWSWINRSITRPWRRNSFRYGLTPRRIAYDLRQIICDTFQTKKLTRVLSIHKYLFR